MPCMYATNSMKTTQNETTTTKCMFPLAYIIDFFPPIYLKNTTKKHEQYIFMFSFIFIDIQNMIKLAPFFEIQKSLDFSAVNCD